MTSEETTKEEAVAGNLLQSIANEIIYSPLNLVLIFVIAFLVYKIAKGQRDSPSANSRPAEPELPKLRRDFTLEDLKNFDGNQADGRVLLGINGTVYDVTKGKRFYGPGEFHSISSGNRNYRMINETSHMESRLIFLFMTRRRLRIAQNFSPVGIIIGSCCCLRFLVNRLLSLTISFR